jgi:hypothetical protein
MTATFEVTVGRFRVGERERPINYLAPAVHLDGTVHGPKSTRLPTLIEPRVMPRPISKKGSSPVPEGVRLAPIRLTCPPMAKALSDIAIVPPSITTASTVPRTSEGTQICALSPSE